MSSIYQTFISKLISDDKDSMLDYKDLKEIRELLKEVNLKINLFKEELFVEKSVLCKKLAKKDL